MTQDEIIEMAQKCGLVGMRPHLDGIYIESLLAFAKLVAEAERERIKQANAPEIEKINAYIEHAMSEVQRLGQEIEQEPVQFKCTVIDDAHPNGIPLEQWAEPQRTWVGLTEQEHTDIAVECGCMSADWVFYGAAVERKLKERNT